MGLRGRLALFFVVIAVVPTAAAITAVRAEIGLQLRERAGSEVLAAGASAAALADAAGARAGDLATDLATRPGVTGALMDPASAAEWLAAQAPPASVERADIVVLAAPDGSLLAHAGQSGVPPEVVARTAAEIADSPDTPSGALMLAVRVVAPAGLVAAGVTLDDALLGQVAHEPSPGSGAAFVADGAVLAATGPTPDLAEVPAPGAALERAAVRGQPAGDSVLVGAAELSGAPGAVLVAWAPVPPAPGLALTVVVVGAAVAAAASIGLLLARSVVVPVQRAVDVARAVAGGDLSQRLSLSGGRELAELAEALNAMTAELAERLTEVERSRDELRRSLSRLGDALSGSLDLDRMVAVVVETAATTLRADGAAVLLLTAAGDALETKAIRGHGLTRHSARDGGVASTAVRTGEPVLLPGPASAQAGAAREFDAPYVLAVPLQGRGQTNGALLLLRDEPGGPFTHDDLATAGSIAAGVAVAIDNIRLHQETERLSLTNPVTGLWNIRYFEPQADRELARARRANERAGTVREVSVLAIDLDHFGRINKEYDQAAGDAALAEVGRRLVAATRVPDVVTHPHGEEFAVLLPDTDYEGALRVAERMRRAVGEQVIVLPGSVPHGRSPQVRLTCSVGVATFPGHADDRAGLYRAADRAMQLAKDRGRDQVVGAEELDPD